MFIDDCEDCKIITGPLKNSIMMRTSKNCTLCTITKQLRFRDCENIKCFTFCASDPAVESSFNIFFAPYNTFFPHLKELFLKAGFNISNDTNHIATPYDFTKDKVMGDGAPHFLMLPDDQFTIEEINDGNAPLEELYEGYSKNEPLINAKVGDKYSNQNEGGFTFNNNENNFIPFGDNQPMQQMNPQQNSDDMFMMGNFEMNPSQSNPMNFSEGFNTQPQNNSDGFNYSSNVPLTAPIEQMDEEEIQRMELRKQEAEERAKKIREKMEYELKMKNQLREEAVEFMNKFHAEREERISRNRKNNQLKEENAKREKEELRGLEGDKINHWEGVASKITLKEGDYKGSNDVTRMRQCIISRKNEFKK